MYSASKRPFATFSTAANIEIIDFHQSANWLIKTSDLRRAMRFWSFSRKLDKQSLSSLTTRDLLINVLFNRLILQNNKIDCFGYKGNMWKTYRIDVVVNRLIFKKWVAVVSANP